MGRETAGARPTDRIGLIASAWFGRASSRGTPARCGMRKGGTTTKTRREQTVVLAFLAVSRSLLLALVPRPTGTAEAPWSTPMNGLRARVFSSQPVWAFPGQDIDVVFQLQTRMGIARLEQSILNLNADQPD